MFLNHTMSQLRYYLHIIILFTHPLFAQNAIDSLLSKDYSFLNQRIDATEKDEKIVWVYLNAFIKKAKSENNTSELVNGYKNCVYYSEGNVAIKYADSAIHFARQLKKNDVIGNAYLTKGIAYYKEKNYQKTLDNYLIANKYLSETNDNYSKYKAKYNFALIKSYLGAYDEAIVLYKECIDYFNQNGYNNHRGYLSSINGLAFCYNRTGQYDLCSKTTALGIKEGKRLKLDLDVQYLNQTEGINQYSLKNYPDAMKLLNQAIPSITNNEDFASETVGYFYIGKCYLGLNQKDKSLPYFFKVDSVFVKNHYIRADLRENYEILIQHYKDLGNKDKQLLYINRLLTIDSILNTNYKYLTTRIIRQYDTKALIDAKKEIEAELSASKQAEWVYLLVLLITLPTLIFFTYRYYKQQKVFRKKYELLMKKNTVSETSVITVPINTTAKTLEINQEVLDEILQKLKKFEDKQDFLNKELTQVKLAEMIKTNSTYLSKVINTSKGKNFTTYINDMRIEYVVEILKTKPIYRMHTIKALADMSGFSTPQNFSDAFFAYTGIRPSYFISQLSKETDAYSKRAS